MTLLRGFETQGVKTVPVHSIGVFTEVDQLEQNLTNRIQRAQEQVAINREQMRLSVDLVERVQAETLAHKYAIEAMANEMTLQHVWALKEKLLAMFAEEH